MNHHQCCRCHHMHCTHREREREREKIKIIIHTTHPVIQQLDGSRKSFSHRF